MAYQFPVKYFNSFWLKKVVGYDGRLETAETYLDSQGGPGTWDYESQVTTTAPYGSLVGDPEYLIPTWPGLPWGSQLDAPDQALPANTNGYPCFPWGGVDWLGQTDPAVLPQCGGSLIYSVLGREDGRDRQWFVEEARIRGGFNNTSVDFGVKAYLVEDENLQENRFASIIYSGIYNSRTGVNETNVFNTAEPITKSIDPENGSIQKLYAYNTNLTIFQENKISKALIDKDAIYSAEGTGTPVSSLKVVIGQIVPYSGEYGISTNPESWAQYGFRQYFADRFRNSILRLSRDGITEISSYGMTDYFRDTLSTITTNNKQVLITTSFFSDLTPDTYIINFEVANNLPCNCLDIPTGALLAVNGLTVPGLFVVDVLASGSPNANCLVIVSKAFKASDFKLTDWPENISFLYFVKDKIIGGFDTHNKNYVVSIQSEEPSNCAPTIKPNLPYSTSTPTLNFDEAINGWVSFYTYTPILLDSIKSNFYSSNKKDLYQHYSNNVKRGEFYGIYKSASIEFIFNPSPSTGKNFQTIAYEGTNGWQVDYIYSDATEFRELAGNYISSLDTSGLIYSLQQGAYTDPNTQTIKHSGFYLKENKYVTNLINSTPIQPEEIFFGNDMSGLKGYFVTVKLSTDDTLELSNGDTLEGTDVGGMKELYAVTTKWVVSSQ